MQIVKKLFQLVVLAGLMVSCSGEKKETKSFVRPVKYQKVGYLGGEKIRTFSGTAKTDKIINLSFRSSGIITDLDMRRGQEVKKGQLLSELDNVQARLNYESAIASQNSAASQMNTAKLALNRTRSLFEKGSASLSDFEAAKNSYKTAKESFESSKRSVAIQQEQIRYGYLYAPADGVIAAVSVEIDENVTPGQHIGTLNAGTNMEIALGIPESVINMVKKDDAVEISFSSITEKSFEGIISEVAPSVDPNTATYPVRIKISNPTDNIKTGMAANVTFDFGEDKTNKPVLVVPAHAVGEDSEGRFVFLINENGEKTQVKRQQVKIGDLTAEGFEIASGLKAGQKIATAGLQTLLDGQTVKLQ